MSGYMILVYSIMGLCVAAFVDALLQGRASRVAQTSRRRLEEIASRVHDSSNETDLATILRSQDVDIQLPLASTLDNLPLYHNAVLLLYRAGIATPVWKFALYSLGLSGLASWIIVLLVFRADAAIAFGLLVLPIPWLFAYLRKRKRMTRFEHQLPEALDLMCRGLRAGHGFSSGLQMVSNEFEDPIAPEFGHVADEIALGLDTRDALRNLTHRIDVPDLRFMSTAMMIQRETGGNLAEVMGRLAHVIRDRHTFYGKTRAMTAQNRGAATILLAMPIVFVVFSYFNNPTFVAPLYTHTSGNWLGGVTFLMTVGGYLLARRLAVVDGT
ncbi:MAG: type II secretion system F family protein [Myxococcota bacterium]|nr:type II secretion system F family protein [Myxococcota bacterium]